MELEFMEPIGRILLILVRRNSKRRGSEERYLLFGEQQGEVHGSKLGI